MNKIIYYLARVLSVLIVLFFALFILEGFDQNFTWQDSATHFILMLVVLVPAVVAFLRPKIGGWIFIIIGIAFMFFFRTGNWSSIIIGGVPLITGILFLIESRK